MSIRLVNPSFWVVILTSVEQSAFVSTEAVILCQRKASLCGSFDLALHATTNLEMATKNRRKFAFCVENIFKIVF